MAEKWDVFRRIGKEHDAGVLIVVNRDIIDYFTDIAKATDDREMGGFLLGDYVHYEGELRAWLIVHFHDYIQVPNASKEPTKSFVCLKESLYEVGDMISAGRYNAFTLLHTHPSDSYFSVTDLHTHYKFPDIISDAIPEHARKFQRLIPHFLVTGGRIGFVMTYTKIPHSVCYYAEERYKVVSSKVFLKYLDSYLDKARLKYPEDHDFYIYVAGIEYTALKISELEDVLAWEETKRGRELIEEMKERMRREIERRLRQL